MNGKFGGGIGTEDNPLLIEDIEDFKAMNNVNKYFKLKNDIDLKNVLYNSIFIEYFIGKFDGSGKAIKNLKVNTSNYFGLFASHSGTIKNLIVENANITATDEVGCIAAQNTGIIEMCTVKNSYVCMSSASWNGTGAGLLVGFMCGSSVVKNCKVEGTVKGVKSLGGLIGHFSTYQAIGKVENCYSSAKVDASSMSGAMFGTSVLGKNAVPTNCFYDKTICNISSYGGTGITNKDIENGIFVTSGFRNEIYNNKKVWSNLNKPNDLKLWYENPISFIIKNKDKYYHINESLIETHDNKIVDNFDMFSNINKIKKQFKNKKQKVNKNKLIRMEAK